MAPQKSTNNAASNSARCQTSAYNPMRLKVLETTDERRNAMPAHSSAAGTNTPLRLTSSMRSTPLREEARMPLERLRDQGGVDGGLHGTQGFSVGVSRALSPEPDQLFSGGRHICRGKLGERLLEYAT